MSAVVASTTAPVQRSEGVWRTAWRRFKGDRVGMVSLVIVLAFLLLIVAAASGLVASQWQRELAVPNAPPTLLGPRAAEDAGTLAGPDSTAQKPVDLSDIDPLAPRYAEWAERAAKLQTAEASKVDTLPLGADRLGRDVLDKAIKGTEVSVFVGVLAALLATVIGTVLGALAGFFGGKVGDFLEWLYNVFTAVPDILLIFAFAAVLGRGVDTVVLILALTGWTGLYRQVRAEFIKHSGREYVRAVHHQPHVPPHPAQRQPCDPGAHEPAGGGLHQERGDPVLPGPGRAD
jgi:oligopeptide transport system permease protein